MGLDFGKIQLVADQDQQVGTTSLAHGQAVICCRRRLPFYRHKGSWAVAGSHMGWGANADFCTLRFARRMDLPLIDLPLATSLPQIHQLCKEMIKLVTAGSSWRKM